MADLSNSDREKVGDYTSAVFFDDTDYEIIASSRDDEDISDEEVFDGSEGLHLSPSL